MPDAAHTAAPAKFSPTELADLTIAPGVINAHDCLAIAVRRPPDSPARMSNRAALPRGS